VKLLFDNNLSPRLPSLLVDVYPNAAHVALVGLQSATDDEVWEYAREGNFVIVTKDGDFNDLRALRGVPPKLVWLRVGNCPTSRVAALLRRHQAAISALASDEGDGLLILA